MKFKFVYSCLSTLNLHNDLSPISILEKTNVDESFCAMLHCVNAK